MMKKYPLMHTVLAVLAVLFCIVLFGATACRNEEKGGNDSTNVPQTDSATDTQGDPEISEASTKPPLETESTTIPETNLETHV